MKKTVMLSFSIFSIFLVAVFVVCIDQVDEFCVETRTVSSKIVNNENIQNEIKIKNNNVVLKNEYENFPINYKGYKVVGKIKIPKIEIEKYILEETNEKALKVALTKTYGPKANEIGNFCISGHNYIQTFGKLKELDIGDKILLTDTYNREVTYKVYKNYKVDPTDTTCLSQETNGEREITLITCTLGAIKRTIIKAVEIYD